MPPRLQMLDQGLVDRRVVVAVVQRPGAGKEVDVALALFVEQQRTMRDVEHCWERSNVAPDLGLHLLEYSHGFPFSTVLWRVRVFRSRRKNPQTGASKPPTTAIRARCRGAAHHRCVSSSYPTYLGRRLRISRYDRPAEPRARYSQSPGVSPERWKWMFPPSSILRRLYTPCAWVASTARSPGATSPSCTSRTIRSTRSASSS